MGRLGYAAVNLGEREVLLGYERLREQMKKASFPFLSANLVYQDSAEPFAQPHVVKTLDLNRPDGKKGRFRIGILGLVRMNPGLAQPTPDGRRIVTSDPAAVARKVVPALRQKSDFVVALVAMEPDQAKSLAKEVPGIDLILGGFGATQTSTGDIPGDTQVAGTRILFAGNQGKSLGEARVFLDGHGRPSKLDRGLVSLSKIVPDDPDVMDLVEKNRLAVNEINRRNAPLVDVEKLRAMYEGASYVRAPACKSCHEEEYRIWEESKHAHAFQVLEEKHQDYNPECVACHTTGFRRATGFLNAKSTPDLTNVQCEACHGPGKDHPEKVGRGYGPVGREFCVTCHTVDNSPDFDPVAYMVKIRHWKPDGARAAAPAFR